jgi:hypothetical protein
MSVITAALHAPGPAVRVPPAQYCHVTVPALIRERAYKEPRAFPPYAGRVDGHWTMHTLHPPRVGAPRTVQPWQAGRPETSDLAGSALLLSFLGPSLPH